MGIGRDAVGFHTRAPPRGTAVPFSKTSPTNVFRFRTVTPVPPPPNACTAEA